MSKILNTNKKQLAILIDPEKTGANKLTALIEKAAQLVDFYLVGGSILTEPIEDTVEHIKKQTSKPVVLFPGNACHVTNNADVILFLAIIAGRNAEFFIGNQVISAPIIKRAKLQTLPTCYILIDCGKATAVEYISNTKPIPYSKNDIAVSTAIAGEMLGLKALYLEAGSGADTHVPLSMISDVKKNISIPLIVGGGIRSAASLHDVYNAGADIVVIGTAFENDLSLMSDFENSKNSFN